MKKILTASLLILAAMTYGQTGINRLWHNLQLELETTTTVAGGGDYSPLWLSSNRYGLSSVEKCWNYERAALHRNMADDSTRNWKIGYGADLAVMFGGERTVCVQEAFFEAGWKAIYLTVGSKKQPLMLKNESLTSGGLSYGINARPIPQIRIGAEYFSIPFTHGWWQWKGHVSYGWRTDGIWQKHHIEEAGLEGKMTNKARRTEHTLYHEKALYWKFGNERVFPMDLQFGLQWATEFGGTAYSFTGRNHPVEKTKSGVKMKSGVRAYLNAFKAGGTDVTDGAVNNTQGNHLGSWNVALTYRPGQWMIRAYGERFFEDISQLGLLYGISDHLFGLEIGMPKNPILSTFVLEHVNSRQQTGAVYHDRTDNLPEKMNGRDNYYNHNIYTGWQNYGMTIGSPLLTAPLYNAALNHNGEIACYNNRVRAWHIGLAGNPIEGLDWRIMMSFSKNWGTYEYPFPDPMTQSYTMAEVGYAGKAWKGWGVKGSIGMDHGAMLGNSTGGQLTVTKRLNLNK